MHAFSDRGVWVFFFFSHDVSFAFAFTPLNGVERGVSVLVFKAQTHRMLDL